jgi:hypothetical protein
MYQSAVGNLNLTAGGSQAINIDATDITFLKPLTLAAPLPIASGGTNATTQQTAINNLMPAATAGNFAYSDGTNWVVLASGVNNRGLTMAANVPSWNAISTLQFLEYKNNVASIQAGITTTPAQVGLFTLTLAALANSLNRVRIQANLLCGMSTNNGYLTLSRGSTEIARFGPLYSFNVGIEAKTLDYVDDPGTVGPHTYSIRVQTAAAGGTLYINRDATSSLTGFTSTFSVEEIGL